MVRGIYLRANGELQCFCGSGEQISLGHVPLDHEDFNFVEDFYFSSEFRHIRNSMGKDQLPFPLTCLKCTYLDVHGRVDPELFDKEIEWFHIEPSSTCNLRCPFCVHGISKDVRKYSRSGPKSLPYSVYKKIFTDIRDAGLAIKWMYFGGRGDAGMHPDVWRMVKLAKDNFATNFLVNTNGNIPYDDLIVDSGLDKIKLALDDLDQEVYARYRINGKVSRVLDLTKKIVERKISTGSKTPEIIWQRVIFSFNDSDESLAEYKRKANECGVDSIKFVTTFTKGNSKKRPKDISSNIKFVDNNKSKHNMDVDADGSTMMDLSDPMLYTMRADKSDETKDGEGGRKAQSSLKVEFLDNARFFSVEREILREMFVHASNKRQRDGLIAVSRRILHWLQFGQPTRDDFDDFSRFELSNPMLYKLRADHPDFFEYIDTLQECFANLMDIYNKSGDLDHAKTYDAMRKGVQEAKSSILLGSPQNMAVDL